MSRSLIAGLGLCACLLLGPPAQAQPTPVQRANALVGQMTQAEKLDLVSSGKAGVPRLGIPPLSGIDGPNGIGESSAGVTAFPSAVDIGASWDPKLAFRYGAALGAETLAKGHTVLFAPTLNIVRTPLWGRAAETLGEDPFLTSTLVAPEVAGIQSAHAMAEPKHFAGNNQEIGRLGIPLAGPAVNDQVDARTLQEIYFPGFKSAVQRGGAASVMCSYNQINGTPSCQNPLTLGILKGWGLQGFVEPDALLAVRDVVAAFNAGVDNFQLGSLLSAAGGLGGGGGAAERAALQAALTAGTVSQSRLDDAARRIVLGMIRVGLLDRPAPAAQAVASTAAHRALATDISAESSVLLQNRRVQERGPLFGGRFRRRHHGGPPVLPLSRRDRSIAVIGYDAGLGTQIEEGGSPAVLPGGPIITPLAGIRARAPRGTSVIYAPGTLGVVPLPIVPASVLTPSSGSGQGLSGSFYAASTPTFTGSPVTTRVDPTLDFKSAANPLTPIPGTKADSARWTGTLTVPRTGEYRFSLTFSGNARLFINGQQVITGDTEWVNIAPGSAPDQSFQGLVDLTAGQKVPITVEYATQSSAAGAELHLGWQPPDPSLRAQAVAAARRADVAVVFANDVTGEGMDRPSLSLPGDQDQLIEAVARVNPRTVVVLHTASAVLMPWRDQVAAIVEAWYPGQQSGQAIAKTLFGDVDPSGRLPVTFPASVSQGPTANDPARYPGINNVAQYSEGLEVGYRWFEANAQRPLFPFGYGLSYTTFSLGGLRVVPLGNGSYHAFVRVRNTGTRAGADVVELYVGDPARAGEPSRQLKAFRKVFLFPGQAKTVVLRLDASSFQVYDLASNSWRITPGNYHIYAGASSTDLPLSSSVRLP